MVKWALQALLSAFIVMVMIVVIKRASAAYNIPIVSNIAAEV